MDNSPEETVRSTNNVCADEADAFLPEVPRSGSRIIYDDEEQATFVSLAVEIGVHGAMQELGYPKAKHTAERWMENHGFSHMPSLLTTRAVLAQQYGIDEQLYVGNRILETLVEKLENPDISARDAAFVAKSFSDTVTTMRLVGDKATSIVQSVDGADKELRAMILDVQEVNAKREAEIEDAQLVASPTESDVEPSESLENTGDETE